jgi:uncharacterized damage-inducible protein DinB
MSYPLIQTPGNDEFAPYYKPYIALVNSNDLLGFFRSQTNTLAALLREVPEEKYHYRYAEGKWTVLDVAQHIIDSERIFAYRLLTFARGDKTELPGFEENEYAKAADTSSRSIESMIKEYKSVRSATLTLFESLQENDLVKRGTAFNKSVTVRALGYIMAGHELHHINVIRERYL